MAGSKGTVRSITIISDPRRVRARGKQGIGELEGMANLSGRVLVVDDDAAVRSLASRILRREGYAVVEAADGTEALRVAAGLSGPLDLLLADVVLPGMNGAELAAELRSRIPDLPVVYMSGYEEEELAALGIGVVGAAYITKPFTADVLTLMVRGALGPVADE